MGGYHLVEAPDPEVTGLLALILLTDARREARLDDQGRLVLLADQDRTRWDHDAIEEGTALVKDVLRRSGGAPGTPTPRTCSSPRTTPNAPSSPAAWPNSDQAVRGARQAGSGSPDLRVSGGIPVGVKPRVCP
ncbi:hypothetical protein GCM10027589_48880 [Actinocorallia lasiicapitis]